MVINFVDYSLNQGAPAGHESADTPSGHESNGAVAGDRTSNQMVPLPLPLLRTNQATYQRAATTLFHDMMHRDIEFRLRLNPKKYTFGVTSGKLLGHIISERDICEPIFPLLRKSQPTVWDDDCQRAFEKIKECLLSSPILVSPTPGCPLLLYLMRLMVA
ncbi:hypothetical protein CK203_104555 [Vitis vinifera]|uniref:Reverse transcriptase/retrotransposon-derived protein RNase H-like domain-containing protein n=1 Tax=Vitis vinifera TaxID=29760 RepID=A0A438FH91_VITVI|nr:hypothetical protein CK203_104555 [Vitis vinifera]